MNTFCVLQDLAPIPWRQMATSVPLWGLIFAQIGHDWGFFTLVTDLPKYFKDVMKFKVFEVRIFLIFIRIIVVM